MRFIEKMGVITFCLVLFILGILSLVLPKKDVSEYEKRKLAEKPDFSLEGFFKGSYTKELDAYYADNFPFRDGFIKFGAFITELRGVKLGGARIYGDVPESVMPENSSSNTEASSEYEKPQANASSHAENPVSSEIYNNSNNSSSNNNNLNAVEGELLNGLFIINGRAFSLFGGNRNIAEKYAGLINNSKALLGDSVNVYSLAIPTGVDFYLPDKYKNLSVSQKENIDFLYSCLNPEIIKIQAYEELAKHSSEYIFFNTDHHWTGLGAYYAYTAFSESANINPKSISDFEAKRIPGNFLGTLYSQTLNTDLKNNPDYVEYYLVPEVISAFRYDKGKPHNPLDSIVWYEDTGGINSYGVFLGGDFPMLEISTNNKNGQSIAVVKESFGNAFAPFLISHFEKIYIIDMRYFELNLIQFVEENNISNLLFINNIFAINTAARVNDLERIILS